LLALPRPVAPRELPALVLDDAAIHAVEARDERLARASQVSLRQGIARTIGAMQPDGALPESPREHAIEQVRALYLEWGAAEAGGGGSHAISRREAMDAAMDTLTREGGPEAVARLRSELLTRLPAALSGSEDEAADEALLGAFPRMLARYGLTTEGRVTGPPFVIRVLYAARFNVIVGLPPTASFTPVESEAYWGWLALGPSEVDPGRRMDALARYERARGATMPEARAYLLWAAGRGVEASRLYEAAYEQSGALRLRNHALAAAAVSR